MVRFYCSLCEKTQPVIISPLQKDSLNGDRIWGDIVCSVCYGVIATIEADEPGRYNFVRDNR